jgi:hypothetical protein
MLTTTAKKSEDTKPPIKPSHVFFGDSSISFVLPKKYPNMYAKISLETTMMLGSKNQIRPS